MVLEKTDLEVSPTQVLMLMHVQPEIQRVLVALPLQEDLQRPHQHTHTDQYNTSYSSFTSNVPEQRALSRPGIGDEARIGEKEGSRLRRSKRGRRADGTFG
jgi:hypothetical protein